MRDAVAVFVVFLLIALALSMATSLNWHRRAHFRLRRAMALSGRKIIAEIPYKDDLSFFTEDTQSFQWDAHRIAKSEIRAVKLLITGASIASFVSSRFHSPAADVSHFEVSKQTEPIEFERERWDVSIELEKETILVPCGSIRERVSQELARQVYEAVRTDIKRRDQLSSH